LFKLQPSPIFGILKVDNFLIVAKSKVLNFKKNKGKSEKNISVLRNVEDPKPIKNPEEYKKVEKMEQLVTYSSTDLKKENNKNHSEKFQESFQKDEEIEIPKHEITLGKAVKSSKKNKSLPNKKDKDLVNNLSKFHKLGVDTSAETYKERKVSKLNPKKRSKWSRKKKRLFKIFFFFGIIFLILGIFTTFYVVRPALRIRASLNVVKDTTYQLIADFDDKNLQNLDHNVTVIRNELAFIDKELNNFKFLNSVPLTKGYYKNLEVIRSVVNKSDNLVETSLPQFKELLGDTGFTFLDIATVPAPNDTILVDPLVEEEKEPGALSLIMSNLPMYLDLYEELEPDILDIFAEINKLDPTFLPSVGGIDAKAKFAQFQKFTDEYPETSNKVLSFLEGVPELLGANKSTTYLLVLQNETEMRASGGLITAYGTAQMTNGEFEEDISLFDVWKLHDYVVVNGIYKPYPVPYIGQAYLMDNGCGSSGFIRPQDAGNYPDLNWTMTEFATYYDYATQFDPEEYPEYDHILIINHDFAENLIGLIQPLEIPEHGEVTRENLFEFIKLETDDPTIFYDFENRKNIIKDIANVAKKKFVELPITEMPKVARVIIESFNKKDIAIASLNPEVQAYLDSYNMSGKTEDNFNGDYFHLNEAQNCSLKLNKWVRDSVKQDIYIQEDGSITKNIEVKWEQPQVYDESIKKSYDTTGRFTYRAWIRLFVPDGSTNFESDGYLKSGFLGYIPQEYYDDVENKYVSDNIIRFDHRRLTEEDPIPGKSLNVSYDLPEELNYNSKGEYKLLIQKHPGKSWGEKYNINVFMDGQMHNVEFVLDRDKVVTFKSGIITVDNYNDSLDWIIELVDQVPFERLNNNDEQNSTL
jgi:hypothetical protein